MLPDFLFQYILMKYIISENIINKHFSEHYVIVKVKNSCDTPPKQKGNKFISSKPNKNYHGIGIKSINRIAQKYDGSSEFEYNDENKMFCAVVMLKNKI